MRHDSSSPSPCYVRIVRLLSVLLLPFALSGCDDMPGEAAPGLGAAATAEQVLAASVPDAGSGVEYLFGFDLRNGPREDARQFLPLLEYLGDRTGYRFRLRFTASAEELVAELISGKLQFAAIGAGTYLTAQADAPIRPLVRGVNAEGESGYRAMLVVGPDSTLRTVQDLKGRRVAFGSPTSTQGHWIPRIMFDEAGIALGDLGGYMYTGSHRACAEAVISRHADACGMQDTLARSLVAAGSVRLLAVSGVYPSSGIFSHGGVPEKVQAAVQAALVEFDPQGRDRAGLYHWESTEMAGGFAPASPNDYATLRRQAEHLGLLTSNAVSGGSQ